MKTYYTIFPQDIDARIIFGFFGFSTITMCEVTKPSQLWGHFAALTRSHLIGDYPSGLTKEQTTETMDPSPKTKGLRPYPRQ